MELLKTLFSVTPDIKVARIKYIPGQAKATLKAIFVEELRSSLNTVI